MNIVKLCTLWRLLPASVPRRPVSQSTVHFKSQGLTPAQEALMKKGLPKRLPVAGVNKVVLVASGKGGVGKSTTAVNLAMALSQLPRPTTFPQISSSSTMDVGILDADVYGPSIPKLLNVEDEQPEVNSQNLILPVHNYGVKIMSMGLLMQDKSGAIVWRGLMVMGAIEKLLRKVLWGPLDVLVVDMPPGTGDVQLSISQNIPIDGAVLVSTPQQVALIDAHKGAVMFEKVAVPLLGFVENMSEYVCPQCGHHAPLFCTSGKSSSHLESIEALAVHHKSTVLARVPLQADITHTSDHGQPIVISQPNSEVARCYQQLAQSVLHRLQGL